VIFTFFKFKWSLPFTFFKFKWSLPFSSFSLNGLNFDRLHFTFSKAYFFPFWIRMTNFKGNLTYFFNGFLLFNELSPFQSETPPPPLIRRIFLSLFNFFGHLQNQKPLPHCSCPNWTSTRGLALGEGDGRGALN
jgi:hypothetical protein